MTEQSESIPTDAFNASSPMPSIWRRSVALALFFTILGPPIGTVGMIVFFYFFTKAPFYNEFLTTFIFGQISGTPFAAVCGIILAVRAAFSGRVNILETTGAALAATIIVMGCVGLHKLITSGRFPAVRLSEILDMFMFFGGPSLFAALVCYWLFYLLFWPRKADGATK